MRTERHLAAVNHIKPSEYSLLEILISLMVERTDEGPADDLWSDEDHSAIAEIFRECSTRARGSQPLGIFPMGDDNVAQDVGASLDETPESAFARDGDARDDSTTHTSALNHDPFGSQNIAPATDSGTSGPDARDVMDTRDGGYTHQWPLNGVQSEVTPPTKRIVPFSFGIGLIDRLGPNYPLPSVDTVWYETKHVPFDNPNAEGYENTWPPHPGHDATDPPPSSPPPLMSDAGSTGSSEPESHGNVVNIVLSEYISSGHCYDAYRGVAEVQYAGYPASIQIPIVAKYLDCDAEMPKAPGYDIYDGDERSIKYETECKSLYW